MKILHRELLLATALATGLAVAIPMTTMAAGPDNGATVTTNPGFQPSTGQINPGKTLQAPSSAPDRRAAPSMEEARAALMTPGDANPVLGQEPAPDPSAGGDRKTVSPQEAKGDPTTATGGQAAIGGPLSPGATEPTGGSNQQSSNTNETTGARPNGAAGKAPNQTAAVDQARPGPIGATGQTMPSKFSERNDVLDRVPIMAWPLMLSEQDRQRIVAAVMADKTTPVADADALKPASELSTEQALNGVKPFPESLRGIEALNGLAYVKTKSKVLLVRPAMRTVVDELGS